MTQTTRTEAQPTKSLKFRADVEGLRGIAILLVVAYHVGVVGLSGGYIGVDVFFVLSGYLITGLLLRDFEESGRISLVEFYARRVRRLLPAATIVLLATVGAAWLLYAPFQQLGFTGTAIAAAAYISNLWFARESVEYLAPNVVNNPFLHTWSLSVEEQFYLFFPVLLVVTMKSGSAGSARRRIAAVVVSVAVVSIVAEIVLTRKAQPLAFFTSPARAWEFAIGALGILATSSIAGLKARTKRYLTYLGVGSLLAAATLFDHSTVFPGVAALVPAVGTALILTMRGPSDGSLVSQALSIAPLQWLGRLSYSWYLWHWPVLIIGQNVLTKKIVGATGFEPASPARDLFLRAALAVFALSLAWLTFHTVEHPIRTSRALAKRPRVSLALAAALTTVSLCTCWTVRVAAGHAADTPSQRSFTQAWLDIPRLYPEGCHASFLDTTPKPCTFAAKRSTRSIVLFGDSHAAQWFPAAEKIAEQRGWRLLSLTKSACPAAMVARVEPVLGRDYSECREWRQQAIDAIIASRPEAVIMSSWSGYVDAWRLQLPGGVSVDQWRSGTADTLRRFSAAGIDTLLLRDSPRPGFDVPACLSLSAWNPTLFSRSCTFDRAASFDPTSFDVEREAASAFVRVIVVDLANRLCGTALCSPSYEGKVVYRDAHHITATFAATLAPALSTILEQAIAKRSAPISISQLSRP